jgi:hypothetical protein
VADPELVCMGYYGPGLSWTGAKRISLRFGEGWGDGLYVVRYGKVCE